MFKSAISEVDDGWSLEGERAERPATVVALVPPLQFPLATAPEECLVDEAKVPRFWREAFDEAALAPQDEARGLDFNDLEHAFFADGERLSTTPSVERPVDFAEETSSFWQRFGAGNLESCRYIGS